jgi:hypothetical protein
MQPLRARRVRQDARGSQVRALSAKARRCRRKFLRFFPGGFHDDTYVAWERDYKWQAHLRWEEALSRARMDALVRRGAYAEIAAAAVAIEARTNLLFSFEKMALRDAVRDDAGARAFALGLRDLLHGRGDEAARFDRWIEVVARLPRKQTRVLTWPLVTVFPFLAAPEAWIFFKPVVTRTAAEAYGFDLAYASRPSSAIYAGLVAFAEQVRADQHDLEPRDFIDLQSFIWVQGSDEYEE